MYPFPHFSSVTDFKSSCIFILSNHFVNFVKPQLVVLFVLVDSLASIILTKSLFPKSDSSEDKKVRGIVLNDILDIS